MSQNSRESASILSKIKQIPRKLHNIVGSIIFGNSQQSNESLISNRNMGRYHQQKNKIQGLDYQGDEADNLHLEDYELQSNPNWVNKNLDEELLLDNLHSLLSQQDVPSQQNYRLHQDAQAQRKQQQRNQQLRSEATRMGMPSNQQFQQNAQQQRALSNYSQNFNNAYQQPLSNSKKSEQSMWSKYNQRFFKQDNEEIEESEHDFQPKKPSKINCIKIMAERLDKNLITADNKRRILANSMLNGINAQQQIVLPVVQRSIRARDFQPIKGKRESNQIMPSSQMSISQSGLKVQQSSKKPKLFENEDQPMLSQYAVRKSNNPQLESKRVKQVVLRAMTSEDLNRLGRDALSIKQQRQFGSNNNTETAAQDLDEQIDQLLDEKVKQLAPKIIMNEIKQQEKKLTVAQEQNQKNLKIDQRYQNNAQIQAYLEELKLQQEEIQKKNQDIFKEKIEEMKKILCQDSLKECFKQILQEQLQEKESLLMSQLDQSQLKSQIPDSQASQQYNLMTPDLINEIRRFNENFEKNKTVIMQSQDSYNKQNSEKSNISLQDLISESPREQSNSGNKGSRLEPIKEEKDKKEEQKKEEKKVEFKFQLSNQSSAGKSADDELNKSVVMASQQNNDKSPSFGDRSEEKGGSSVFQQQESFVSESLSTPEKSPKSKVEEIKQETKPVTTFQFKANFTTNTTQNTGSTSAGALPQFKFNIPTTTVPKANPESTSNEIKAANPFLVNKVTPTPVAQSSTNPPISVASNNPFINVKPASNPFLTNIGNNSITPNTPPPNANPFSSNASQPMNNSTNPFQNNNSAAPNTGFNNQFKSPFATGNAPFKFQSNSQPMNTSGGPSNNFNSNQFQSSQPSMNNPFSNNNNNNFSQPSQNNNSFMNNSNNSFSQSQPSFQNNSNSNGFNNNGNSGGFNFSRPPMQPFNNATNFQSNQQSNPPNQFQQQNSNNFNGNNPFRQNSNNPFQQQNSSTTPNGGGFNNGNSSNPFMNGGGGGGGSNFNANQGNSFNRNENNNNGQGNGGGGFQLGTTQRKNTQANQDDSDDLFATGGRKIYKAKRNF